MPLTHITKCLLCPAGKPARIVSDPMPQVKPGEQPPEAVGRYVQALTDHIRKKHPEAYAHIYAMAQIMMALLVVREFETTDPGVGTAREQLRNFIHRMTRKNDVTETDMLVRLERIDDAVRFFERDGKDAIDKDRILDELRNLRNFLLEEGEYQPAAPDEARIVTA